MNEWMNGPVNSTPLHSHNTTRVTRAITCNSTQSTWRSVTFKCTPIIRLNRLCVCVCMCIHLVNEYVKIVASSWRLTPQSGALMNSERYPHEFNYQTVFMNNVKWTESLEFTRNEQLLIYIEFNNNSNKIHSNDSLQHSETSAVAQSIRVDDRWPLAQRR